MTREAGFYLTVPGVSIYVFLVILVYFVPVQDAFKHTLTSDTTLFYGFLTAIFYPLSLILITCGNHELKVFNMKWLYFLSSIPFFTALILIMSHSG